MSSNKSILTNAQHSMTDNDGAIVSDYIYYIFQIVNYAIIGQIVNVFGTFANIINIVVFVKMGFSDPSNVSLLGLAISDLGGCSTLIWHHLCFNPLFQQLDLPFDPEHIQYLTGGWPHGIFTRIAALITAFISVERCMCVLFPLKVKTMITPKKVIIFQICTIIFVLGAVAPIYYISRYSWQFDPDRNRTILRLTFTDNRDEIEAIFFPITTMFVPVFVFIILAVCTTLLVGTLREKAKWREKASTQTKSSDLSSRDKKVSKMVILISTLFLICFFPIILLFVPMVVEKEFSINGKYRNLFNIGFSFDCMLESLNSALNIFIYYNMSSNYRAIFDRLVKRKTKK